jgi:membrane protein implicated in regulation of membrane protease activity
MTDLLEALGGWSWWIVAGLLLLAELTAPGIFFLWLAIAAGALGIIVFFFDIDWQLQIALWAILSVVFVVVAKPWLKRRNAIESDQPNLNRRMLNYVGRSYVLDEPIVNGQARIKIEDTLWQVSGPDMPKGAWIRLVRADGLQFIVEPVDKA